MILGVLVLEVILSVTSYSSFSSVKVLYIDVLPYRVETHALNQIFLAKQEVFCSGLGTQ